MAQIKLNGYFSGKTLMPAFILFHTIAQISVYGDISIILIGQCLSNSSQSFDFRYGYRSSSPSGMLLVVPFVGCLENIAITLQEIMQ